MRPAIVALFATAAALTVLAGPVRAQEPDDLTSLSPEELSQLRTETGSHATTLLQKITDAPASVSIVTAEEIRMYGYRTLADVLNSVRGMSVSYDRNYTYLGFRGLSMPGDLNTRILILINGHRLNDNVFDSALIGEEFPLDLENVSRVEVIRGPGAAMYGTSAFSAVISVVTKRSGAAPQGLETTASIGTFDARRLRMAWTRTTEKGVHVLFSGSTAAGAGDPRLYFPEFDRPETNRGIAAHADGQNVDRLAMSVEAGSVSMQAVYGTRTKHIPTASFGTLFNDARTRTSDERGFVDVQYGREVGQRSDFVARGYWDHYHYDGWYVFANDSDTPTVNRDHAHGTWVGGEFTAAHLVSARQRVTASSELRQNLAQDQLNYDDLPSEVTYLDDRRRLRTWAVNVQDEFTLSARVQLSGAVRYESVAAGAPRLTPKAAVITRLSGATTVKFLYSGALRSPSVYERFYQAPPNYVSNPSLAPEQIETGEVAIEHAVSPLGRISASIFANRLEGLIVSRADETGQIRFVNGLNTAAHGFEIAWNSRSASGVHARASYAQLWDSKEQAEWFGGAPRQMAKVNMGVPIERVHIVTGLSMQVAGTRWTHTGDMLPAAVVTNWNVVRTLRKGIEIQGSIFNLFDVRYSEPASNDHVQGSLAQDGRQISIRLQWRLF
jgi:iron complex outermembrane receptor protein